VQEPSGAVREAGVEQLQREIQREVVVVVGLSAAVLAADDPLLPKANVPRAASVVEGNGAGLEASGSLTLGELRMCSLLLASAVGSFPLAAAMHFFPLAVAMPCFPTAATMPCSPMSAAALEVCIVLRQYAKISLRV
jgi:hypothetical protein